MLMWWKVDNKLPIHDAIGGTFYCWKGSIWDVDGIIRKSAPSLFEACELGEPLVSEKFSPLTGAAKQNTSDNNFCNAG